ncbi:MAG: sodium:dicarboxylate symporter [Bacteroides sp. SM23_62_1]|nr:MAG: sodium:dicarboxylate symporter [Bacteroides sp. SM23_62_1]
MKLSGKYIGFILGVIIFLIILLFTDLKPGHPEVTRTLAVALLMATWWVTETIPLAVTALVPLILFPALGILDGRETSTAYINHIIFIFIGGFIMALAMEKWNLHKRIALKILMFVGVSPGRILLGFMFATLFLSMWISNTATTMMMIPIVMSIIASLEENLNQKSVRHYSTGLFLAIAYTASVGGMATLVGTPTNLVCPRILTLLYPGAPEISFASWFFFAFPVTLLMSCMIWLVIFLIYRPKEKWTGIDSQHFREQYRKLGKASYEEKVVFILFVILALLWIFRASIEFDSFSIPGWSVIFGEPDFINDGTVAMLISVILFIIPAKNKKDERLMDWKTAHRLPWNIVLLFGGGFALALGFQSSGLALWFGEQLSWTKNIHPYLILAVIVTMMSFLTELTSNVASTQMLLPVFASLAIGSGNNPILFMIPATLASSLAFMLPTATPPNAIVFGTERIQIKTMVKTGFVLNMTGVVMVTLITWLLGNRLFEIVPNIIPAWAGN